MKSWNKFILFLQLLLSLQTSFAENNTKIEFDVGVILDLDEVVGKLRLTCMSMALGDFYATHAYYKTRVVLHYRDSNKDVIGAASAAQDLLKNTQVNGIIGLETPAQANLVADLGSRSHVPLLSFTRASPSLSSPLNPYFIKMFQNDSSQLGAIVPILNAFRWTEAIAIYEENDYGNQALSYLIDAFQENEIRISYASAIYSSSTDEEIGEELHKLMRMQCKVFVVHVTPSLSSRLFLKAHQVGMMSEGYAFIVTDSVTNILRSMNSSIIQSMQGVVGVRPYIPKSKNLHNFKIRLKKEWTETTHLSIYELWAYDTVWALAMAVEKVGGLDYNFLEPKAIHNSSCLTIQGVSKFGPELVQAISDIRFRGLSGDYHLVNKQLVSSLFQIVNVIGIQGREIGIWSPKHGIMKDLKGPDRSLRPIIWPGETVEIPQGWSFSTNGRTLKIGVPIVYGFDELVKVRWDHHTKSMTFTGFCVDLFNALMKELPYDVPYEFIGYNVNDSIKSNASGVSTYNHMIYQVYLKKLDAVVGDISISANRSLYVDFTIPFTETGLSMIMLINENPKKDAWVFLKPLSWQMWVTSTAAFIFTGCVIWILEHRVNTKFRGSTSEQLGMIFWFSFSTIVFAHRERVMSNLSRFVLIIWVFVVLILTSSYTASLTSMLTVQQLDGGDIKQLMKSGAYVGYQSKVVKALLTRMGFDESKLKELNSLDEFDNALSRGSTRGGVSAIIDEIPYLKLFLTKHCDKYHMVGTVYDTNGLGYVFQKGSPLVLELSKALQEFKETQKMKAIELKWFNNAVSCMDPGSNDSLKNLTVGMFGGLFLVTFIASICALILFLIFFVHKHAHVITDETNPEDSSIGKRLVKLVKLFYIVDISQLPRTGEVIKPEAHTSSPSSTQSSIRSLSRSQEIFTSTRDEDAISREQPCSPSPDLIRTTEMALIP